MTPADYNINIRKYEIPFSIVEQDHNVTNCHRHTYMLPRIISILQPRSKRTAPEGSERSVGQADRFSSLTLGDRFSALSERFSSGGSSLEPSESFRNIEYR